MTGRAATLWALLTLWYGAAALADGHDRCLGCHGADEFADYSVADVASAIRDSGIPPHKRFSDLSDEDVQAIAAELAGS